MHEGIHQIQISPKLLLVQPCKVKQCSQNMSRKYLLPTQLHSAIQQQLDYTEGLRITQCHLAIRNEPSMSLTAELHSSQHHMQQMTTGSMHQQPTTCSNKTMQQQGNAATRECSIEAMRQIATAATRQSSNRAQPQGSALTNRRVQVSARCTQALWKLRNWLD